MLFFLTYLLKVFLTVDCNEPKTEIYRQLNKILAKKTSKRYQYFILYFHNTNLIKALFFSEPTSNNTTKRFKSYQKIIVWSTILKRKNYYLYIYTIYYFNLNICTEFFNGIINDLIYPLHFHIMIKNKEIKNYFLVVEYIY